MDNKQYNIRQLNSIKKSLETIERVENKLEQKINLLKSININFKYNSVTSFFSGL